MFITYDYVRTIILKIDNNIMLVGGIIVVGAIVWYLWTGGNGKSPLGEFITRIAPPNKMSPEQEEEQASMYANYY